MEPHVEFLSERVRSYIADAEWRAKWHARLGRGEKETEGKFYERLAGQVEQLQQDLARCRGELPSVHSGD